MYLIAAGSVWLRERDLRLSSSRHFHDEGVGEEARSFFFFFFFFQTLASLHALLHETETCLLLRFLFLSFSLSSSLLLYFSFFLILSFSLLLDFSFFLSFFLTLLAWRVSVLLLYFYQSSFILSRDLSRFICMRRQRDRETDNRCIRTCS